jgi:hypothetical protein
MVPQMMTFNQIGKSSILFSSEAPHVVGLHLIVVVFSARKAMYSCALAEWISGMNGGDDLNEENGVSFIDGARSCAGRCSIDSAIRSLWRRQRGGNTNKKAFRCRHVTALVVNVDLGDERSGGI